MHLLRHCWEVVVERNSIWLAQVATLSLAEKGVEPVQLLVRLLSLVLELELVQAKTMLAAVVVQNGRKEKVLVQEETLPAMRKELEPELTIPNSNISSW